MNEADTERRDLLDRNRVKNKFLLWLLFSYFDSKFFKDHEESLIDLIHEKEELEQKVLDLEATTREWAQKFVTTTDNQKLMQTNHVNMLNNLKQQYKTLPLILF